MGEVQYNHPDYHGISTKQMFVLFLSRCIVMMITAPYLPQIFSYHCTTNNGMARLLCVLFLLPALYHHHHQLGTQDKAKRSEW